MRKFLLFTLVVLVAAGLYAGGSTESGSTGTTTTATAESWDTPARYATPADFTKATGRTLAEYSESPAMTQMVNSGELPPLKDRLPSEPAVMRPWNEIGTYGGTLTVGYLDFVCGNAEHLLDVVAPDFTKPVANVAKGYDLTNGGKTLMLYLRKGMKWSDGYPFTADDFVFWYEDILLNQQLTPAKPSIYSAGGEFMKLTKIDDYTVQMDFAAPYPAIIDVLASDLWWEFPIPPAHYMKQWHIDYNDKANDLAKQEGFENWWQAFAAHRATNQTQQDTNRPVIYPWVLDRIDSAQNMYYRRNPYYFMVDTDGNQLPYFDEAVGVRWENNEVKKLKVISGEYMIGGVWQSLADYPLYKGSAEESNYTAMLWPDPRGSMDTAFTLNFTSQDPIKRKLFNDIRFREALSVAVDRDEINNTLFFGLGVTRQASPPEPPASELYESWMGEYYAEYDPDKANQLLDEMGLKWDGKHEFRLRSDGDTLSVNLEYGNARYTKIAQLTKEYWEAVGVKTNTRELAGSIYTQRQQANDLDMGLWALENTDFTMRRGKAGVALPPWTGGGVLWQLWYQTGGASGEEPPAYVQELYDAVEKWSMTVPGTDEYLQLGKKIWTINVQNLTMIGFVGMVPYPVIMSNDIGNRMPDGSLWSPSYQQWVPYEFEQWFLKK